MEPRSGLCVALAATAEYVGALPILADFDPSHASELLGAWRTSVLTVAVFCS